jgi:N-methylhydantoinase A
VPEFDTSDAPIQEAFEQLYASRYGQDAGYRRAGIQALTYMVHASGSLNVPSLEPEPIADAAPRAEACAGHRPVIFASGGPVDTPVFRSEYFVHGNLIPGPAIIEAPTTTLVVHPQQQAAVDAYRNIILNRIDP